jgi:protease IV
MSLDADTIVDRRRMRRKLTFWRVVAVLIAVVAVIAVAATVGRTGNLFGSRDYIARIEISGLIRGNRDRVEALEKLGKEKFAKAVIVHVDSPGGTTAGAEQLYDSLVRLKAAKPMVIVVDSLAASGGYIAAMAGDHIIAQSSSLVGSIGVLVQFPNVYELLKTLGIKMEAIKSSPLKAAPNGFEPTSPEARAAMEAIIKDSYAWFRGLVQKRRHMDDALLTQVADGRVFTGRQGLQLKLIDELGDENAALAWLAKEKGVNAKLKVRDYKLEPRFNELSFLHLATIAALNAVGLTAVAQRLETWGTVRAIERLNLDGLLALWHPPVTN